MGLAFFRLHRRRNAVMTAVDLTQAVAPVVTVSVDPPQATTAPAAPAPQPSEQRYGKHHHRR